MSHFTFKRCNDNCLSVFSFFISTAWQDFLKTLSFVRFLGNTEILYSYFSITKIIHAHYITFRKKISVSNNLTVIFVEHSLCIRHCSECFRQIDS